MSNLEKVTDIVKAHHDAAAHYSEASHHHRQAAFCLTIGKKDEAKAHATAATTYAKFGMTATDVTSSLSDYDLDVKIDIKEAEDAHPAITSYSLCTPGCGNTGTGNSFCCILK